MVQLRRSLKDANSTHLLGRSDDDGRFSTGLFDKRRRGIAKTPRPFFFVFLVLEIGTTRNSFTLHLERKKAFV